MAITFDSVEIQYAKIIDIVDTDNTFSVTISGKCKKEDYNTSIGAIKAKFVMPVSKRITTPDRKVSLSGPGVKGILKIPINGTDVTKANCMITDMRISSLNSISTHYEFILRIEQDTAG